MGSRLVPKSVILNDLERPLFLRYSTIFASFGANNVKLVEDIDSYCLSQNVVHESSF